MVRSFLVGLGLLAVTTVPALVRAVEPTPAQTSDPYFQGLCAGWAAASVASHEGAESLRALLGIEVPVVAPVSAVPPPAAKAVQVRSATLVQTLGPKHVNPSPPPEPGLLNTYDLVVGVVLTAEEMLVLDPPAVVVSAEKGVYVRCPGGQTFPFLQPAATP